MENLLDRLDEQVDLTVKFSFVRNSARSRVFILCLLLVKHQREDIFILTLCGLLARAVIQLIISY